ncbi:MAG: hypothetical protein OXFUSZZB_002127 [Candidatus Fervidibacter sp.]|jgi:ABC-type Fe3+/spermidine/putrescine transport system ATPase subunit|nr:ABC transporter ATP-binding protein [Armatimonadota bacterium]MDT7973627.1 ABC transporter ATP-binding protein [Armatimonadota bacterium]
MLQVTDLTVRADGFTLRAVTLTVPQGACGVVLGPSGAGKSTLLEAIAGLRQLDNGRIWLDGQDITDLPPERRNIAFVPQDYALFPHLTAKGNILLAPRLLRLPSREVTERFRFLCDLLNLHHLLDRRPHQLSGGERQRVALARALMLRPKLLLLDEPFAALDPQMRPTVRRTLRHIFQRLQTTVLIVTHDVWDAAALGDVVFVLENGRIVQKGTWRDIVASPQSAFVAEFIGINRLVGVVERKGQRCFLRIGEQRLPVSADLPDGAAVCWQFFPSQVRFADAPDALRGVVDEVMELGDRTLLVVELAESFLVRLEAPSPSPYIVGDVVSFIITAPLTPTEIAPTLPARPDATAGTP